MKALSFPAFIVLFLSSASFAGTIQLRDFTALSGGVPGGWTQTRFDDVELWGPGSYGSLNWGGASGMTASDNPIAALVGVKDLFVLLPKTVPGQTIQINSATIELVQLSGATSPEVHYPWDVHVRRVTTNWLTQGPGLSQGTCVDDSQTSPDGVVGNSGWAGGAFSSADYAATGGTDVPGYDCRYINPVSFTITDIVRDWYANDANYGLVLLADNGTVGGKPTFGTSENMGGDATAPGVRPALIIDYSYVPIPEPATMALLAAGGLALLRRRR